MEQFCRLRVSSLAFLHDECFSKPCCGVCNLAKIHSVDPLCPGQISVICASKTPKLLLRACKLGVTSREETTSMASRSSRCAGLLAAAPQHAMMRQRRPSRLSPRQGLWAFARRDAAACIFFCSLHVVSASSIESLSGPIQDPSPCWKLAAVWNLLNLYVSRYCSLSPQADASLLHHTMLAHPSPPPLHLPLVFAHARVYVCVCGARARAPRIARTTDDAPAVPVCPRQLAN